MSFYDPLSMFSANLFVGASPWSNNAWKNRFHVSADEYTDGVLHTHEDHLVIGIRPCLGQRPQAGRIPDFTQIAVTGQRVQKESANDSAGIPAGRVTFTLSPETLYRTVLPVESRIIFPAGTFPVHSMVEGMLPLPS